MDDKVDSYNVGQYYKEDVYDNVESGDEIIDNEVTPQDNMD